MGVILWSVANPFAGRAAQCCTLHTPAHTCTSVWCVFSNSISSRCTMPLQCVFSNSISSICAITTCAAHARYVSQPAAALDRGYNCRVRPCPDMRQTLIVVANHRHVSVGRMLGCCICLSNALGQGQLCARMHRERTRTHTHTHTHNRARTVWFSAVA